MRIQFSLNRKSVSCEVEPNQILLDLLRDTFKVSSVKRGCDFGECGACTVLLNSKPVCSCLLLAPQVDGAEVLTVESLTEDDTLSFVQKAFAENFGFQCGYCTPGMILTAKALLDSNPNPSVEDVKTAIEGNYCRCTGYEQILKSILKASEMRRLKNNHVI